ncbi:MAG: hypothetical protein Q8R60_12120 [Mycobacteriales bacterium]|nr:hypothetical protein [Mycobacteriales bacterium]
MGLYDDVYAALHAAGVRFVVVGGTAVVHHGHVRLTVDLDLVVDLAVDNAREAVRALTGVGLRPLLPVDPVDFADPAIRTDWVDNRNLMVFTFFDPASVTRRVDVFAIYPVPFEALHDAAVEATMGGVPVKLASRQDLLVMKRAAGRPQDLLDIEALEALPDTRA